MFCRRQADCASEVSTDDYSIGHMQDDQPEGPIVMDRSKMQLKGRILNLAGESLKVKLAVALSLLTFVLS